MIINTIAIFFFSCQATQTAKVFMMLPAAFGHYTATGMLRAIAAAAAQKSAGRNFVVETIVHKRGDRK